MCWKGLSIATLLLLLFPTYQEGQEHLCSSWEEWLARKHRTLWIHFRYVQIAKPPPSRLFRPLLGRSKNRGQDPDWDYELINVDLIWTPRDRGTWSCSLAGIVVLIWSELEQGYHLFGHFQGDLLWFWCSEIIAFVSLIVRTFAPVLRTAKSLAERNTVTPSAHQQLLGIGKLWSFVNFWGNETNWCVESNCVFCQEWVATSHNWGKKNTLATQYHTMFQYMCRLHPVQYIYIYIHIYI